MLFLFDARQGVTPIDRHFASWLRKSGARAIVLVGNKCERGADLPGLAEGESLEIGRAHV